MPACLPVSQPEDRGGGEGRECRPPPPHPPAGLPALASSARSVASPGSHCNSGLGPSLSKRTPSPSVIEILVKRGPGLFEAYISQVRGEALGGGRRSQDWGQGAGA